MSKNKYKNGSKFLVRMVQHMRRIDEYLLSLSEDEYKNRGIGYDGVNKQIDLLGEQVSKLFETKADNIIFHFTDVPWAELRALRNRLSHDYFSASPEMVWQFLRAEFPRVQGQITEILRKRYGIDVIPPYSETD